MDRGIEAVLRIDSTNTDSRGGEAVEKYVPGQRQRSMNECYGNGSVSYLRCSLPQLHPASLIKQQRPIGFQSEIRVNVTPRVIWENLSFL